MKYLLYLTLASALSLPSLQKSNLRLIDKLSYRDGGRIIKDISDGQGLDSISLPEWIVPANTPHPNYSILEPFDDIGSQLVSPPLTSPTSKLSSGLTSTNLLMKTLYTVRYRVLLSGILRLLNTSIQILPSLLVRALLRSVETAKSASAASLPTSSFSSFLSTLSGLQLSVLLYLTLSLKVIVENAFFTTVVDTSTKCRHLLNTLVFENSFSSPFSLSSPSTTASKGIKKTVNATTLSLVTSDIPTVESLVSQVHTIWDAPLQVFIYTKILRSTLGPCVNKGMLVLLLSVPLSTVLVSVSAKIRRKSLRYRDQRYRLMSDFIDNAKVNKITNAEGSLMGRIERARKKEIVLSLFSGGVRSLNSCVLGATTAVVLAVTLAAKVKEGGVLKGSDVFTAVGIFNQVRFPVLFYPMVLSSIADGLVSSRRISDVINTGSEYRDVLEEEGDWRRPDKSVGFKSEDVRTVVENSFDGNKLVAVVGKVGDGKSDLCKALTNKVPRASYFEQDVWLPSGTLFDAIAFGREFDQKEFDRVVEISQLKEDLEQGILTMESECGEGGGSLSGGQRARVALARTLYFSSEVIIDDCFASLDSRVKMRVSDRLMRSGVRGVMVTNDWEVARNADMIVQVAQTEEGVGRVEKIGRPSEFQRWEGRGEGEGVGGLMEEDEKTKKKKKKKSEEGGGKDGESGAISVTTPDNNVNPEAPLVVRTDTNEIDIHVKNATDTESGALLEPKGERSGGLRLKVATLDELITSKVPLKTYTRYLATVKSPLLLGLAVSSYCLSNFYQVYQQGLVAKFTSSAAPAQINLLTRAAIYVAIAQFFRSLLTTLSGTKASQNYHRRMLRSLSKAPMAFFDGNPSGQITNRFGKELDTIDRSLPDQFGWVVTCFLQIAFSSVAIATALTPLAILPLSIIGVFYVNITSFFRSGARSLKVIETKTRGPINQLMAEAKRGSMVIKSLGAESFWKERFRKAQTDNIKAFYGIKRCDRFLSVRLESLANVMVFATALLSTKVAKSAGFAGWGLSQALAITGLLNWAVRCLTETEQMITSTQRVQEIIDVEPEMQVSVLAPKHDHLMNSGWPWRGEVEFEGVDMRYTEGAPLVLKDFNLKVGGGESVGIVGRTGSGKSSVLLTLFRLMHIHSGTIKIDGVDISSVPLEILREMIATIPQDSIIYEGTLRDNLCFDLSGGGDAESDQQAWKALEIVAPELAGRFSQQGGLECDLGGGASLSEGEKSLVVVARALYARFMGAKLLVLDEATAKLDTVTEERIGRVVKEHFIDQGITVMAVAHRTDSLKGFDRIIEVNAGKVVGTREGRFV